MELSALLACTLWHSALLPVTFLLMSSRRFMH